MKANLKAAVLAAKSSNQDDKREPMSKHKTYKMFGKKIEKDVSRELIVQPPKDLVLLVSDGIEPGREVCHVVALTRDAPTRCSDSDAAIIIPTPGLGIEENTLWGVC